MKVPIADIKIGPRFRKDLGDIEPLADSIKQYGLLHPVVVTEDIELICGRRRIEAFTKLGLEEIEASIVSLDDQSGAEADENIVRKDFTVSEIAEVDEKSRDRIAAQARERMLAGKKQPCDNLAQGQKTRDLIARKCGISGSQLDKIRAIKIASIDGGIFQEIWEKAATDKIKIDKAYNQVRRFQRIKQAEELANSSLDLSSSNGNFLCHLGPMQELKERIPSNSVSMIFTDPPYGVEYLGNYADLAQLAQKVLNPGDSLLTYAGHHLIFKVNDLIRNNSDLIYHWQIVVRHEGPKSRVHPFKIRACYKPLLWYYKPKIDANGKDHGPTMYHDVRDLVESKAVLKDNHEWEQSTKEAIQMIEPLTVEGNTVLDPFMGSGTTGLAALQLNRRFIGIEMEEGAFKTAKARLYKAQTKD